jgi:chorismate dehydratase
MEDLFFGLPGAGFRLGRIAYRNVLPVYHPLEQRILANGCLLEYGPPAALNLRLRAGELDAASISSIEYARNPERYLLVPDLAIGCHGPVRSVLLLSRVPLPQLDGERILVSAETHTSAMLLKLLLRAHWGIDAHLHAGNGNATSCLLQTPPPKALLAIGDEALLLRGSEHFPVRVDLGEVWRDWTGLPFVFGVWALRREVVERSPEEVARLCTLLQTAKRWGRENLERLLPLAGKGLGLGLPELRDYFQGLCYDLGQEQEQGLRSFFQALARYGLLETVPELRYAPNMNAPTILP